MSLVAFEFETGIFDSLDVIHKAGLSTAVDTLETVDMFTDPDGIWTGSDYYSMCIRDIKYDLTTCTYLSKAVMGMPETLRNEFFGILTTIGVTID